MAFRGMHPQDSLHIVKEESHRYTYGNGRADTHGKHQDTNDTAELEHVRLDNPHHSNLQQLPLIPSANNALTGYLGTARTRTETNSTTTPRPSNSWPPHWATQRTQTPATPRRLRLYTRLLLSPTPGEPPSTPTKTPTPAPSRVASTPRQIRPMVRTLLNPSPRRVHQMHLWPCRRRNLGPFQDVPPVPRARHSRRLEPNPHHCAARRKADRVPDDPTTRHHPQEAGSTPGDPQVAHPHCRLHPATHPRGEPQATAAHMLRTAVTKTAEQLTYRTHKYLQHAATLPPADHAHLLKLLFYQQ